MAHPFCSMKKRTAREVFTFLSVRFLESLNIKTILLTILTPLYVFIVRSKFIESP